MQNETTAQRTGWKIAGGPVLVGITVLALDQWLKGWALRALGTGTSMEPVGGVLRLVYVENTGVAFGLFAGASALLGVVAALVILGVLWHARLWLHTASLLARLSSACIVAGGVGNIIDRIRHGFVVDFLHLIPLPIFQVFNSADVAISVGGVGLFIALWRADRTAAPAAQPPDLDVPPAV